MRIFYSGFEGPFHSCVEKVISQCDFMVSFATIGPNGRCERLEALDRDAEIIPDPGIISGEDQPNG